MTQADRDLLEVALWGGPMPDWAREPFGEALAWVSRLAESAEKSLMAGADTSALTQNALEQLAQADAAAVEHLRFRWGDDNLATHLADCDHAVAHDLGWTADRVLDEHQQARRLRYRLVKHLQEQLWQGRRAAMSPDARQTEDSTLASLLRESENGPRLTLEDAQARLKRLIPVPGDENEP